MYHLAEQQCSPFHSHRDWAVACGGRVGVGVRRLARRCHGRSGIGRFRFPLASVVRGTAVIRPAQPWQGIRGYVITQCIPTSQCNIFRLGFTLLLLEYVAVECNS